jgi:quercetin dioxygenase-like cupin family protein
MHQVLLASPPVTDLVYTGNAQVDGKEHRGWILGHFMPGGDIRHSEDLEIRWAVHQDGERRGEWVAEERRTTAIILISGRFKVELPGQSVTLAQQGDYILFHGVSHSWEAETDCVVLGIRWPSVPGYQHPGDSRG